MIFIVRRRITTILISLLGCIISQTNQEDALELLECATSHSNGSCSSKVSKGSELSRANRSSSGSNNDDLCRNNTGSSLICSPMFLELNKQQSLADEEEPQPVQVYIRSPNNASQFEPGSALTLECRFITRTPQRDFKFNLRWLRSVASSQGNQSIAATDYADSMTIIATTTKIWTVQRGDGLDLEVNDFQADDVGSYFCQAHSGNATELVYSEARLDLGLILAVTPEYGQVDINKLDFEQSTYSQENLSKLLPSLKVFPSYAEIALGDTIQLACLSSHLDPDPEPQQIEWTFEGIVGDRRSELLLKQPSIERQLPANVSLVDNQLIIWSMSAEHKGLYKCTVRLPEFNLTAQAVGELALRPTDDAAPLVRVTPEFVRLPLNGSATIQCEATGYPPPELSWYRVDQATSHLPKQASSATDSDVQNLEQAQVTTTTTTTTTTVGTTNWLDLDGFEFEKILNKDTVAYCEFHKCLLAKDTKHSGGQSSLGVRLMTGISLLHVRSALAHHQGQYVCLASNKHGSNQASSIVDVEFREPPRVSISSGEREKTIHLMADENRAAGNITFKCTVQAGRPQPRVRWLRSSSGASKFKLTSAGSVGDNLDIYDLTRVSSATSTVSTWLEDGGRSLVLSIGTVSLDDEGDYVCLAENEWGRHTASARLLVRKAVSVRIAQASPMVAKVNGTFQLDCLASGHPLPLDLEWSRSDLGAFFSLISRRTSSQSSEERAVLKFDRASVEDSGEYTCNARDHSNSTVFLRDTIMVLVEPHQANDDSTKTNAAWLKKAHNNQLPKLMVRPTKVTALPGSNVTLDCLAVSGLQPTVVEWLAPANQLSPESGSTSSPSSSLSSSPSMSQPFIARPYFMPNNLQSSVGGGSQLMQFGSKLRIINVGRQHEGIYQCKGRNKFGVENAPALVKLLDNESSFSNNYGDTSYLGSGNQFNPGYNNNNSNSNTQRPTKTKVAKLGSNIELKCQVNGIEQPATSWSRDGLELPMSSVQIGHNLWIQNLSSQDAGLYICSARSKQPNKVIQAKINLLVHGSYLDGLPSNNLQNLSAKIVASKSLVNVDDSITLECIISNLAETNINNNNNNNDINPTSNEIIKSAQVDLEELESGVVWTNLHSGQSLFQDNVYIQNNLLIIYQLRPENSATYRCNYNDLTQYTDYKLQLLSDDFNSPANLPDNFAIHDNQPYTSDWSLAMQNGSLKVHQVALGSRFVIDCALDTRKTALKSGGYFWTRSNNVPLAGSSRNQPLVFESITSKDADLYQCHQVDPNAQVEPHSVLVQVSMPVARFAQRPISFATLPSISGADHQLDIELKFLPERDHGLILFNGQQNRSTASGDYISLGLNKGFLEFRFELGDGVTLLRSLQPVALNQWHKMVIERNRRGAVMWLDKQPPVSNSSSGKFFNLNLDSVLYVGGHHHLLAAANNGTATTTTAAAVATTTTTTTKSRVNATITNQRRTFYGYSRGFQGCVALLRISGADINLMARNRSVDVGVFECDKQECANFDCSTTPTTNHVQQGACQVDRTLIISDATRRSSPTAELRCICLPGWQGERCDRLRPYKPPIVPNNTQDLSSPLPLPAAPAPAPIQTTTMSTAIRQQSKQTAKAAKPQQTATRVDNGGACAQINPCSANGTIECRSLTSTSYKCHCQLGFIGETCNQVALFSNETSVAFNQQAYLQLRFHKPDEVNFMTGSGNSNSSSSSTTTTTTTTTSTVTSDFNATNFARLSSMAEQQNISFKLQTRSSFGLLFYTGQANLLEQPAERSNTINILFNATFNGLQTSKSMVANLLARLSSGNTILDYLAIALVDGHVELSYELGSGVAIVRSSQRVNDGDWHQIRVQRVGKWSRLSVDELHHYEGRSPGRLSSLNSQTTDIYLGGLPNLAEWANNTHLASLVGCLSQLEINSLGPLNLIKSDRYSQVRGGRNLAPCQQQQQQQQPLSPAVNSSSIQPDLPPVVSRHKPYQAPPNSGTESDDPDEM